MKLRMEIEEQSNTNRKGNFSEFDVSDVDAYKVYDRFPLLHVGILDTQICYFS